MDYDWQIKSGDMVHVFFDGQKYESDIYGTVRYTPQATGDSWIIETPSGEVNYVQTYAKIVRVISPCATGNAK